MYPSGQKLSRWPIYALLLVYVSFTSSHARDQEIFSVAVIDFRNEPASTEFRRKLTVELNKELVTISRLLQLTYESASLPRDDFTESVYRVLRANPDVVYATTTAIARQVRQISPSIPIVFSGAVDPLRAGLINSWDRPGRNMTGFVSFSDTADVRWSLLREAFGKLQTIGIVADHDRFSDEMRASLATRAATQGLRLTFLAIHADVPDNDLVNAIRSAKVDAFDVVSSTLLRKRKRLMIDTINAINKPAIYQHDDFVKVGGLISYTHIEGDFAATAATYIRKIATGTPAGEIPIGVPTEFRLAINLTTAKSIRPVIAPSFLKRADLFYR